MTWPVTVVAMLVWTAVWLFFCTRATAAKEGDSLVEAFGRLMPPFAITTCLAFSLVAPRKSAFSAGALWIHHAAFLLLLAFLLVGQYLQLEALWKIRAGLPWQSICATYRRHWVLTTIAPAPIALTILLTGLRLLWQQSGDPSQEGGYSLSGFWLQGLVIGFSLFFWDGIFGYTPIVRSLYRQWNSEDVRQMGRPAAMESAQLLIHLLSWPVVFLIGALRDDSPTPLTPAIASVLAQLSFLPPGWPDVIVAVLLWLLMGAIVGLCRYCLAIASARIRWS